MIRGFAYTVARWSFALLFGAMAAATAAYEYPDLIFVAGVAIVATWLGYASVGLLKAHMERNREQQAEHEYEHGGADDHE